jgi:hypothetical protein
MSDVKPEVGQVWVRIKTGFEVLIVDTMQDGIVWKAVDGVLTGTSFVDMNKLFKFKSEAE